MNKKLVTALILLFPATSALADEGNKFYLDFNLGRSMTGYDLNEMNQTILDISGSSAVSGSVRDKVFSYAINAGYMITPRFGVELGLGRLGESEYTGVTSDLDQFNLSLSTFFWNAVGVARYPIGNSLDLIGKAGVAFVKVDEELSYFNPFIGGFTDSASDSNSGLTYGAGVKWSFAGSGATVNFEYNSYDTGVPGVDRISVLFLGYGFGY